MYKLLTKYKNYIDKFNKNKRWDKVKKISNDYELIYTTEKRKRKRQISISQYEPISRSYYKLTEMFCDFNLIEKGNNGAPVTTAHIAEGPGGFLEALINYRKNSNDMIWYDFKITSNIPDRTFL